ncbi:hypothetical protein [Tardiphaga sp. 42S5]|uniref:hypothetical protein n=1 Tax=unclassified Tardiphaga TaxID=2631404 RepID=UPI002A59D2C9|nr:hypothetical protein [Tardiphaga sp. 42S5]WPO39606.1 hypothetical protein SFY93_18875 [Tardiphaga sp. 42S5]
MTWMNRLQGIADDDARALAARKRLDQIQGEHRTRFCDAWTGYWIKGAYAWCRVKQTMQEIPAWRANKAALILLQNRPRVDRISQRTKTILFDKRAAATSFHAT